MLFGSGFRMSWSPLLILISIAVNATDHLVGRRLPDAARVVYTGIDSRHMSARRDK